MDGSQDGSAFGMAVGKSLASGEEILRGDEGRVAKQSPQGLDLLNRPAREISQSTLEDLFVFAPTCVEEDGGQRVTIGDGFDVQRSYYAYEMVNVK